MNSLRICHVNAYETFGGSAKAALRLHQSLNQLPQVTSTLFVSFPQEYLDGVKTLTTLNYKVWMKIQPHLAPLILKTQKSQNPVIHTLAWPPTGMGSHLISKLKQRKYDIVHLHFIGNSTLSVSEIGRIQRLCPVVWTLHDEWPYSGSEHYAYSCSENDFLLPSRAREGYIPFNRLQNDSGLDVDRYLWSLKRKNWKSPFTLVCPSRWMRERAESSILMKNSTSVQIPNALDTSFWKPLDKGAAREALSLPEDAKIILFGATGGSHDPRKGWELLRESMYMLKQIIHEVDPGLASKIVLCVFGQNEPLEELPFDVRLLGRLSDDLTLRLVYSCADVFVLPSRIDNLPTTGTEAQCCALPVAAFSVGGLSDVIEDGETGLLAEPFSVKSLAHCIYKLLDPKTNENFSRSARRNALQKWSYGVVSMQHLELYNRVLRAADRATPL